MTLKQKLLLGLWLTPSPLALGAQVSPTDPNAAAPLPKYESAFDGYRPYKEQPVVDWRAVNEEVGKVGGHVGIFGGAGGPAGGAGQQPARSTPKAPGVQGHAH